MPEPSGSGTNGLVPRLGKLHIATKLKLVVGLSLALIIGLLGFINAAREEKNIIQTKIRSSELITRAMVEQLDQFMAEREIKKMLGSMDMLAADEPTIRRLMLINAQGRVILSTDDGEMGRIFDKGHHACNGCHGGSPSRSRLSSGGLEGTVVEWEGHRYLAVVNPITNRSECSSASCHVHPESSTVLGLITIEFSLDDAEATIRARRIEAGVTFLAAITVVSLVIGFFIRRFVRRPVDRLLEGMNRAAAGDLDTRISVQSRDEMGRLAEGYNRMTSELSIRTRELRETRDYLLGIVENSADLIITVNPDGLIETFNRGAETILGYHRSEVIGRRIEMLFARPAERDRAIRQLADRDNVVNYETRFLRKDGTPVDIILTLSRLRDPQGRAIGTFGISKDVTEYKKLQQELVRSRALAAIGQAIANVIHSVKNILTLQKGGSYMIRTGVDKNDMELIRQGWTVMQSGVDRISDLTRDMLSFSKKGGLCVERGSLNDVVAEVCWAMTKTSDVQDRVDLSWDLDESVPQMMIDCRAFHDALLNLLSNAVDACMDRDYENGVHPRVRVRTWVDRDGGRACIEVRDNGCGICEEAKENIFAPFFSTKAQKGTGLGLAITRKIVHGHGGTISMESVEGEGTSFTIRLPIGSEGTQPGGSVGAKQGAGEA